MNRFYEKIAVSAPKRYDLFMLTSEKLNDKFSLNDYTIKNTSATVYIARKHNPDITYLNFIATSKK
ncbi:hypothetical protein YERSI8AC_200054 [Enterobacterales bacterium 8AC]|nr:hypothetical protein YERSI8AC_200054 [Enterobacterales bacterium 8AC]